MSTQLTEVGITCHHTYMPEGPSFIPEEAITPPAETEIESTEKQRTRPEYQVLSKMSQALLAAAEQVNQPGHAQETQAAYNLMRDLLAAREKYILAIAQARHPDLRSVNEQSGLYCIGESQVYGSLWALLDATPATHRHAQLAEALSVARQTTDQTDSSARSLASEYLDPKAYVESFVQLAGSSAQDRIQEFATDLDFSEDIFLQCQTVEEAKTILSQKLASLFSGPHSLHYNDQEIQIIPRHLTIRDYSHPENGLDGQQWLPHEIRKGGKKFYNEHEQLISQQLGDTLASANRIIAEFAIVNGDEIVNASQIITIQAKSPDGQTLLNNAPDDNYLQNIFFDSPEEFGLSYNSADPKQFLDYLSNMSLQLRYITRNPKPNTLKLLKRLYNFNKAIGNFDISSQIETAFTGDICHIYQLAKRLPLIQETTEQTGNPHPLRQALSELSQLLEQAPDPSPQLIDLLNQRHNYSTIHQLSNQVLQDIVEPYFQTFLTQHPDIATNLAQATQFHHPTPRP